MSAKFTPGPWKIENRCSTLIMAGHRSVASCGGYCSNQNSIEIHNENEANAKLISATPELYRVAELVLETATVETPKELIEAAEAALKKAQVGE